jgi:hypothetical protein
MLRAMMLFSMMPLALCLAALLCAGWQVTGGLNALAAAGNYILFRGPQAAVTITALAPESSIHKIIDANISANRF